MLCIHQVYLIMLRKIIPQHTEALTMVYASHKFKHYLLGNMFTFLVDHMALVHLSKQATSFWQVN
jgi:hypothetical protein